jgi:exosortase
MKSAPTDAAPTGIFDFLVDLRAPTPTERSRLAAWAQRPETRSLLPLGAAVAVAFVATYWTTMVNLVARWNSDENYSHGFLVPIVSAYLALQNFRNRPLDGPVRGALAVGSLVVLVGMTVGYITVLFPSLVAECFSMLLVVAGGVLLLGGREWWKRTWAPILFLLFMAPWPSALYSRVAFPLQQLVCEYAAVGIDLVGVPVLREGNVLKLPSSSMHVAQACSGMRQLTAFLAICTCAVLVMARPTWYRAILFASAIPIAVAINVLRVVATGLLIEFGDPAWTQGWLHTAEGLVMVALGMGLLWVEIRVLDWILDDRNSRSARADDALPQPA